ncbi:Aspartate aminotransferase, mitochondrial [Nowakowskiella sp. JEL0078]|nr:Aspartate aminotransferase, mitochondrial [Nowakowskiella sp. JEL0078]
MSSTILLKRSLKSTSQICPISTCIFSNSVWTSVELAKPDAILGVTDAWKSDKNPLKMNLGVGVGAIFPSNSSQLILKLSMKAWRTNDGEPYILKSVSRAEKIISDRNLDKEYSGILGLPEYLKCASELSYGKNSEALRSNRVALVQSISGTGALRIGGTFLSRCWGNHSAIFRDSGLQVGNYKYYDSLKNKVDFGGLIGDLKNKIPSKSIVLFHACAHNPSGADPSKEQWMEISDIVKKKNHYIFFDSAYQGFASGYIDVDAFAIRHFINEGHKFMLSQSFAKNMGLYGERIGLFSVVCENNEEVRRVESQVKRIIRPIYSSPPFSGARIVNEVLSNPKLRTEWMEEVHMMASRIKEMRSQLQFHLENTFKSSLPWNHITEQIGMFCYSGLKSSEVDELRSRFSVYLTQDGRISISGINSSNVEYLASAIDAVTKERKTN